MRKRETTIHSDKVADKIIDELLPNDIVPLICVECGNDITGLTSKFSRDFLGVHLVDTCELLKPVALRNESAEVIDIVTKEDNIHIRSYEWNHFISRLIIGKTDIMKILWLPTIHLHPLFESVINQLMSAYLGQPMHVYADIQARIKYKDNTEINKTQNTYTNLFLLHILETDTPEWDKKALFKKYGVTEYTIKADGSGYSHKLLEKVIIKYPKISTLEVKELIAVADDRVLYVRKHFL